MIEIYNSILNHPIFFLQKTCEFFGVIFSFIYVIYSIRQNILCWPALIIAARQNILCWPALIIAALFNIPCFIIQELPLQSIMQAFFIITGVYGWLNWKGAQKNNELQVKTWPIKKHIEWIHYGIITTLITTLFLLIINLEINLNISKPIYTDNIPKISFSPEIRAFADALLFIFNIIPMYLTGKKVLESWMYFIIIDIFGSLFYFFDELYFYAFLYFCYIGFASYGYLTWKKTLK